MKKQERPKQGVAKFAEDKQVLYRRKSVLITSYLGGARIVISEPWYLDVYNYSAAELFLLAIKNISGKKSLTPKHIRFDVEESLRKKLLLTNAEIKTIGEEGKNEWYKQNGYCLQITDDGDEQIKYALLFTHLNNYFHEAFGITGSIELRNTACLALTRIDENEKQFSSDPAPGLKDQIGITDGKFPQFVYALNYSEHNLLDLPIIDETNYSGIVTINISPDLSDVNSINTELELFNLKLIEVVRKMKMVVIAGAVK